MPAAAYFIICKELQEKHHEAFAACRAKVTGEFLAQVLERFLHLVESTLLHHLHRGAEREHFGAEFPGELGDEGVAGLLSPLLEGDDFSLAVGHHGIAIQTFAHVAEQADEADMFQIAAFGDGWKVFILDEAEKLLQFLLLDVEGGIVEKHSLEEKGE